MTNLTRPASTSLIVGRLTRSRGTVPVSLVQHLERVQSSVAIATSRDPSALREHCCILEEDTEAAATLGTILRNVVLGLWILSTAYSFAADRQVLKGKVTDSDGTALEGATVMVYSGGVKQGSARSAQPAIPTVASAPAVTVRVTSRFLGSAQTFTLTCSFSGMVTTQCS